MLGLVFSRDQSVRDAAVEAVDVLFLAGAESPVAAAEGLARVAAASALGELAALEEVLKLLVSDGRVPADGAVIKALWAQAGDRASHEASRAAALTVLSMAAADAGDYQRRETRHRRSRPGRRVPDAKDVQPRAGTRRRSRSRARQPRR